MVLHDIADDAKLVEVTATAFRAEGLLECDLSLISIVLPTIEKNNMERTWTLSMWFLFQVAPKNSLPNRRIRMFLTISFPR